MIHKNGYQDEQKATEAAIEKEVYRERQRIQHAADQLQGATLGGIAPMAITTATGRMSGRNVLLDRAERLERQAAGLRALAAAIPDNFPHDADAALWDLALAVRG